MSLMHPCWHCGSQVELYYVQTSTRQDAQVICPGCERNSSSGRWPADAIRRHNEMPMLKKIATILSKIHKHPADSLNEHIED